MRWFKLEWRRLSLVQKRQFKEFGGLYALLLCAICTMGIQTESVSFGMTIGMMGSLVVLTLGLFGLGVHLSAKPLQYRGVIVGAVAYLGGAMCVIFLAAGVPELAVNAMFAAGAFLIGFDHWPKLKPVPAPVPVVPPPPPTTFGSAQWGTLEYMEQHGLIDNDGLLLGVIPGEHGLHRLCYKGTGHLLTIAPTGSGKGTAAIVPNLLTYRGSCVVIDPKAENALITAEARQKMGQNVYVVDPWGVGSGVSARFNPLDWLVAGDIDMGENAMILANALVVPDVGGDGFWAEEAKALLQGLIMFVATDPDEAGMRHLGRVRDLLTLDGEETPKLFNRMMNSPHRIVASTGARSLQKDLKLLSSVLASAQAHTTFLESARLRENLSASDFRFEDLKTRPMTIYLVLPADRLDTFGRWLRLLLQQAITLCARDIETTPEKPVLFIIDEMPALGKLTMVEQAFGLMRGFGMQLWAIAQDAGQLKRLYGDAWEGFVSNAGAITYHGSRDKVGAEYFSDLCGVATVLNFSSSSTTGSSVSTSYGKDGATSSVGTNRSVTHNATPVQRKLIFPDELMRLDEAQQLILFSGHRPIAARKLPWFKDHCLQTLGHNLRLKGLSRVERLAHQELEADGLHFAQALRALRRPDEHGEG